MKIFVFEGNFPSYDIEALPMTEHRDTLHHAPLQTTFYTLPDTALSTRNHPFFVPDEVQPCFVQAHAVVRICRLGRSISPRFAHRYYADISVGACFTAHELFQKLRRQGLSWEPAKSFDGAASLGEFVPLEEIGQEADINFRLTINGEEVQRFSLCDRLQDTAALIAGLSSHYKLCQGDLLFTGTPSEGTEVCINDHIEGFLNDRKLLSFNVK